MNSPTRATRNTTFTIVVSLCFPALLAKPATAQVSVTPALLSRTPCTPGTTVIRAHALTNSADKLTVRVEKADAKCAVSTFAAAGTMELREGSKTGKAVASATYGKGADKVDLTFEPRVIGSASYFAVVASDKNLYAAGPIIATGLFTVAKEATGVKLYQYKPTCSGCATDYVLQVDLTLARIRSLLGDVTGAVSPSGTRSKIITRRSITEHWEKAKARESHAFAIVNFTFFDTIKNRIAFPLKIGNSTGGDLLSYGYGLAEPANGGEFPNNYRYVQFDNEWNTVSVGSINHPQSQSLPQVDNWMSGTMLFTGAEIVAGLSPTANKEAANYIPRMFVGAVDRTGDGRSEILFYSSEIANSAYAARILRGFGVANNAIVQGDGGASAQLLVRSDTDSTYKDERDGKQTIKKGTLLVQGRRTTSGARPVPHIFAIYGQ